VLLCAAVQTWMLTVRGQTVGKRLLGIRIVRVQDDANPGFRPRRAIAQRRPDPPACRSDVRPGLLGWSTWAAFFPRRQAFACTTLIAGTKSSADLSNHREAQRPRATLPARTTFAEFAK